MTMKSMGMDEEVIAKDTGLNVEEVRSIKV